MKIKVPLQLKEEKGFATIAASLILLIIFITGSTLVFLSQNESKSSIRSKKNNECLYLADAGIEKAVWEFTKSDSYAGEINTLLGQGSFNVSVTNLPNSKYELVSTGVINNGGANSLRKIKATIEKDPISKVFDYTYFINNWGWYWGHNITAAGDVRSNGRFDFVNGPKVEGDIYAGQEIDDHGTPVRGIGGDPEHQHAFSEKLPMPNLQSLDYYEEKAVDSSGTVKINGNILINNIYGDDVGESGNIVLIGTSANPIEVSGTVVVEGDLVIKGKVTGQGTIYAGRNIYVTDNLDYKNAPSSPRPAQGQTKDQWVEAHKDKDLVAYAAKESIILGDYTKTANYGYTGSDKWYADQYLFSMGNEDVGVDGIPDTHDAGEGDGFFDPDYEDVDGDGTFDQNYNWNSVQTQADISSYSNAPAGTTKFSDLASNTASKVEGIFYTNHAFAGRTGNGMKFNGSVISKDEAIIYRNTVDFNYDERAHSRYNEDPNRFIDLGLPKIRGVYLLSWQEIK